MTEKAPPLHEKQSEISPTRFLPQSGLRRCEFRLQFRTLRFPIKCLCPESSGSLFDFIMSDTWAWGTCSGWRSRSNSDDPNAVNARSIRNGNCSWGNRNLPTTSTTSDDNEDDRGPGVLGKSRAERPRTATTAQGEPGCREVRHHRTAQTTNYRKGPEGRPDTKPS